MDGLGLTNPLAQASTKRKVAASYVSCLNFSAGNRTSPYCIIPTSICYEKDWSRYEEVDIVCGPVDEAIHGTSLGAQMRRLDGVVNVRIPKEFADHPWVRTDETGCCFVPCTGAVASLSADSPAAGQCMGTKIAFGPATVGISRGSYVKQIDGTNHRAHCKPNSFLPWVQGTGRAHEIGSGLFTGLVLKDESLTTSYDEDFQGVLIALELVQAHHLTFLLCVRPAWTGALQKYQLRTVKSTVTDMEVVKRLSSTDADYYLKQIGVRKFGHAFSRMEYWLYIESSFDLMHIECMGNITVHLSKLLWKMVRELYWSEC
jgi:hypothetical protein